ncbi:MAG: potassium channel family protein [Merdibacter sp.]|uniref:TrkA family potassium uptake protein n=1 Tax=Amedibacillus dolichus TaxID=31971 RepID=A0ABT7U9I4_9FIRM|nr:TrkA family potassium uptake protein [Amedibacillus dolichus]MDM8156264.1 TrkA family potassium uptake protein [Amedibacillus dolichus]
MKKKTYAVLGLGRFGMPLATKLAQSGADVIGVDMDEERVRAFREYSEYAFVAKKLTKEVLEDIGIQDCDVAVICIGSRVETSILVTLNILNLGVPNVISKASSAEQGEVLRRLGADVVYPERDMALRTAKKILRENLVDYLSIGKDIEIIEIEISNKMVNKTILELDLRKKYKLNVIAIRHDEESDIEVRPDCILHEGDTIAVIGREENVTRFVDDYS